MIKLNPMRQSNRWTFYRVINTIIHKIYDIIYVIFIIYIICYICMFLEYLISKLYTYHCFQSYSLWIKWPNMEKAASGWSVGTMCPAPLTWTYHKLPETLAHPLTSPNLVQICFCVLFHAGRPTQFKLLIYCKTPGLLTTTSFWPL